MTVFMTVSAYILCISERHNARLVVFIKGCLGVEIPIGQTGCGIRFPAVRKHVAIIDEMIAKSGSITFLNDAGQAWTCLNTLVSTIQILFHPPPYCERLLRKTPNCINSP
jgi:hypothetical protein